MSLEGAPSNLTEQLESMDKAKSIDLVGGNIHDTKIFKKVYRYVIPKVGKPFIGIGSHELPIILSYTDENRNLIHVIDNFFLALCGKVANKDDLLSFATEILYSKSFTTFFSDVIHRDIISCLETIRNKNSLDKNNYIKVSFQDCFNATVDFKLLQRIACEYFYWSKLRGYSNNDIVSKVCLNEYAIPIFVECVNYGSLDFTDSAGFINKGQFSAFQPKDMIRSDKDGQTGVFVAKGDIKSLDGTRISNYPALGLHYIVWFGYDYLREERVQPKYFSDFNYRWHQESMVKKAVDEYCAFKGFDIPQEVFICHDPDSNDDIVHFRVIVVRNSKGELVTRPLEIEDGSSIEVSGVTHHLGTIVISQFKHHLCMKDNRSMIRNYMSRMPCSYIELLDYIHRIRIISLRESQLATKLVAILLCLQFDLSVSPIVYEEAEKYKDYNSNGNYAFRWTFHHTWTFLMRMSYFILKKTPVTSFVMSFIPKSSPNFGTIPISRRVVDLYRYIYEDKTKRRENMPYPSCITSYKPGFMLESDKYKFSSELLADELGVFYVPRGHEILNKNDNYDVREVDPKIFYDRSRTLEQIIYDHSPSTKFNLIDEDEADAGIDEITVFPNRFRKKESDNTKSISDPIIDGKYELPSISRSLEDLTQSYAKVSTEESEDGELVYKVISNNGTSGSLKSYDNNKSKSGSASSSRSNSPDRKRFNNDDLTPKWGDSKSPLDMKKKKMNNNKKNLNKQNENVRTTLPPRRTSEVPISSNGYLDFRNFINK
jgi:hypothetical protein